MLTWVKYQEYYMVIPHPDGSKSIGPAPWQLVSRLYDPMGGGNHMGTELRRSGLNLDKV